jgi:Tol biopolymer transport system component
VEGITEIWMVSSDGRTEQRITSCAPDFCGAIAWSKDGTHLAYERSVSSPSTGGITPSRIWILETKTGETYPLLEDTGITGFGPLYSPDSGSLAFFDISAQGIRLVNLQDGATIVIPSQMGEVGTFSPDGTQLIYPDIRQVGGQFFPQLWMATLDDTKSLDVLFDNAEEDQTPRWSPDGDLIAFARRKLDREEGFALQLFILDVESGSIRQITDDPVYNNTSFAWSPDGRYLLVQRFLLESPSAKPELWLYDQKDDTLSRVAVNVLGGQWLP